MEVEAVDEGVLGRIVVPEGTEGVAVNAVIGVLLAEGEDGGALLRSEEASGSSNGSGAAVAAADPAVGATVSPAPLSRPKPAESPDAGPTIRQTVREALRDAIAEEMRRDETVFLMGEEVAEYQGAYKVTQGTPRRVRRRGALIDTPITEHGFAGLGVGAALCRSETDCRIHDLELRHAGDGSDRQLGGQEPCTCPAGRWAPPIVFRGPNGAAARVAAQHSPVTTQAWYAATIPGLKGRSQPL